MDLHIRANGAGVRQRQADREAEMRRRIVERGNPQHVVLLDNDNAGGIGWTIMWLVSSPLYAARDLFSSRVA